MNRLIRKMVKKVLKILFLPAVWLVPRKKNQWIFGNWNPALPANTSSLFIWLTLYNPEITSVWLTGSRCTAKLLKKHSRGRVHLIWSPAGVWAALRSSVVVTRQASIAFEFALSSKVLVVSTWHGVGLKSVGKKEDSATGRSVMQLPDYLITTSDFTQQHFSKQFEIPLECCPPLGYPRHDIVLDAGLANIQKKMDQELSFNFCPAEVEEVYLYAPTWRDTGRDFFQLALPNLARLNAILKQRNALLYIKPHGQTKTSIADYSNIKFWPSLVDHHLYLPRLTGMITDYSSILYDYLKLGKGSSILYIFDYEEYISKDRTLIYDYFENTVGQYIYSADELYKAFENGKIKEAPDPEKLQFLNQKFWGGSKQPVSPSIISMVKNKLV